MKDGSGQKYLVNLFNKGMTSDYNLDIPSGEVRDFYNGNNFFDLFHESINALKAGQGMATLGSGPIANASLTFIGSIYYDEHVFHFWSKTATTYIYRDYDLIGQHADYPGADGSFLYMDIDQDTGEIAITDNTVVPVILDLGDMYAEKATTLYKAAYDKDLYEINAKIELTQPAFKTLTTIGGGGGLNPGSYSYSYRMVNNVGDKSPWSPPTPFIPVPVGYGSVSPTESNDVNPGAKWYGSGPSLTPTRYGIILSLRVNNFVGFDYVEMRRQANKSGGPVDYTAPFEKYDLPNNIDGTYNVVSFTDSQALIWAPLDEADEVQTSSVATCRSLRFYQGRLVLGDVTYQSRIINDNSIFLEINSKQGIPVKKDLGVNGYHDMDNQVYNKSQKLGERYSYGIRCNDKSSNRAFVLPIPDLTNYKFPERREEIPAGEVASSDAVPTIPNIESNQGSGHNSDTYEVFKQGTTDKDFSPVDVRALNIVDGTIDDNGYNPWSPVKRGTNNYIGSMVRPLSSIEDSVPSALGYAPDIFGPDILATGMKLGGLDVSALPDWVDGFSVVRSEAAGRVVAQGIGMYALTETTVLSTGASKSLDKLWAYFPEIDSVIGDKASLYDDIKENPGNYQVQLVSPVGFATDVYNSVEETNFATNTYNGKIDMVSYANAYYGTSINPMDADADIGETDGLITFGKFRNVAGLAGTGVGTGVAGSSDYIFDIDSAQDVSINGKNGRTQYLELDIDGNIYFTTAMTGLYGDEAGPRVAHEPWYIINIIQDGAAVEDTAIYKEIGHHIPFNSTIGVANGENSQSFQIVSERLGDVYQASSFTATDFTDFRYVWVDGKKWLDITNIAAGDRTILLAYTKIDFDAGVSITGETIYGIYEVQKTLRKLGSPILGNTYNVWFHLQSTGAGTPYIVPEDGKEIQIRYDENEAVDIFLGDTVIAETGFTPIDCATTEWNAETAAQEEHFEFSTPMPYKYYDLNPWIYVPDDVAHATPANRTQRNIGLVDLTYLRQWMVNFICESSINFPMVYKDFWPHINYVMRPNVYDAKGDDESVGQYLESLNIYTGYNQDYPDEYLNWGYGGFKTPQGYNFDYNKDFSNRFVALPEAGVTEVLQYPKRLQWSTQKPAALSTLTESLKAFLPTNIYDLQNSVPDYISILYNAYSSKGDNLYAITDKGVALVITDKSVLRDGVADQVGLTLQDAGFIGGELWIDRDAGSIDNLFRGRAEGTIMSQKNTNIPVLIFPSYGKMYMLAGNGIIDMSKNMRSTLKPLLGAVDDSTPLSLALNKKTNSLWALIGARKFVYNFDVDNWVKDMALDSSEIKSIIRADKFNSVHDRVVELDYTGGEVHMRYTSDSIVTQINASAGPTLDFAITPGLDTYEFVDMYIRCSEKPLSVTVSNEGGTLTHTIAAASIVTLDDNLFKVNMPRATTSDRKFILNTLYVSIVYTIGDLDSDSYVSYVKTGFREINQ